MDRCGSYQGDQWKTRIASGDIPDYIKTDAIGSGLHDIGAVRVLSEDYLRQHMPNYTKLVDQIAGPYGWQTVTSGGEVVGIPSVNVAIASGATFVTRRDWIEAVGEPIPDKRMLGSPYSDYSSLEDVERLLRTIPHTTGIDAPKLDNGFVPQWDEELRAVANQLREVESEFFFRAIIGQANFTSDWDAYVAEWRRRGGDRLTEEANRQRDSM